VHFVSGKKNNYPWLPSISHLCLSKRCMYCVHKLPAIFVGQKMCKVSCNLPIKKTMITGRLRPETTNKLAHDVISYFSGTKKNVI